MAAISERFECPFHGLTSSTAVFRNYSGTGCICFLATAQTEIINHSSSPEMASPKKEKPWYSKFGKEKKGRKR